MRRSCINLWIVVALFVPVLLSLRSRRGETQTQTTPSSSSASFSDSSSFSVKLANTFQFNQRIRDGSNLEYDFYKDTCPQAEGIVRSALTRIYFDHRDVAPALLRLFFHDCFIQGCDASLLLDENDGNSNSSVEKQAVPNQTLRGFDKIDLIKEEVEQACPGVVSCADIVSLAARDSVLLAGGPFYPVLTGRRDNHQSFFEEATDQIPRPDDNVTRTLHLFNLRGFNARETVSLLGGHNIGKIGCDFIQQRLYNFQDTRQPDPSIPPDFLRQMRLNCPNNSNTNNNKDEFMTSKPMSSVFHSKSGMSYMQALSSSVSSGSTFDTHYYQSLLRGRGLLFADQQLMAEDKTAKLVSAYASDDGSTFRMDFARVMLKMSNLDVLTGLQGQVRLNCSRPVTS
ncbi:putative Peroxidase 48 [Vigna unguiculata]|uniref:Peroxidase n=1 Tax=Vigna unguiculata TaxID=3917 RepID=A0A4D6NCU8_VIGUN|nr:putative Peroxidase 48 [Vigna unguiculata]QCE09747.1 peroxidase [Vigna unguiculata]